MEAKEFEKFYSLCERTVSQQRLLGAEDSDIAYLLHGMIAAHVYVDKRNVKNTYDKYAA